MIANINIKEAGYDHKKAVINDIRFSISAGELVGLIGPNGAGKSTTIQAILGLLKDSDEFVDWSDDDSRYAYVPEQPVFYKELTLSEHLSVAASSLSIDEAEAQDRTDYLLDLFSMSAVKHHLLNSYSKGMQQKALLIIALMIQPDLYIIDEPFIGLDPRATRTFLNLLEEERKRGAGVLMSTHVLDTAEKICDRFLLLSHGRTIADGTLEDVQRQAGQTNASLFDCFYVLTEED